MTPIYCRWRKYPETASPTPFAVPHNSHNQFQVSPLRRQRPIRRAEGDPTGSSASAPTPFLTSTSLSPRFLRFGANALFGEQKAIALAEVITGEIKAVGANILKQLDTAIVERVRLI
jgi:hypothetical protein